MLKHPDFLPPALLAAAHRMALSAGQSLFQRGAPVEHLHWILRGEVLAVRQTPSGQDAVMMRGRAGEFFAEAALFTPHYTCNALAPKPAVLLCLPIPTLRRALVGDPQFSELFLRAVVMALRRQCSRVERLRLRSAADRIEHFLSCEATGDGWSQLDVPLSEWAVDLGLEPETLYRTLRVLEQTGVVLRDNRRIRLTGQVKPD